MSSKTFLTISKKECLVVYKSILENSDRKWEAGINLSTINDYGGATSMAIISVEELVKALIVLLDGNGFNFRRVKGMDAVFKHHQIRYFIAYAMFILSLFSDEVAKFIIEFREKPDELIRLEEEMRQNEEGFFEKNMKRYLFRKMIQLKKEFDWFSQVDIFRQDGFYSDYKEQLKTPITIGVYDYDQVIQRLERVRKVGKEIILAFENQDEHFAKLFITVKGNFQSKKFYKLVERALTTVRQSRESPFVLIKNKLDNL